MKGSAAIKLRNSLLRKARWAAHGLLSASGYDFELRRSGELRLGLWRKTLQNPKNGGIPRRFILVPGFGDSPLSWLYVVSLLGPTLKKKFDEVILIDFPGFQGRLSHERAFDSMDLLCSKLFDVFDSLKPHTILGHSLGGWLASRYAALCGKGERPALNKPSQPSRHRYKGPETLILADSSGLCGNETLKNAWSRRMNEVMNAGGFFDLRPHLFGKEPFWFKWAVPEFCSFAMGEDTIKFMRSFREDHLVEDMVHCIQSKVWLLWGENDTLTPTVFSQGWLQMLGPQAQAQAVLLKGVGHAPHIESPTLTAIVLNQILSQKSTAKGQSGKSLLQHPIAERWLVVKSVLRD